MEQKYPLLLKTNNTYFDLVLAGANAAYKSKSTLTTGTSNKIDQNGFLPMSLSRLISCIKIQNNATISATIPKK